MKKCSLLVKEFFFEFEKLTEINFFVEETKKIEQIKNFFECYQIVKKRCNLDFIGMLFVKASVYNEDGDLEYEMKGEDYEKIQKEKTF